jgi:hypothetical protein
MNRIMRLIVASYAPLVGRMTVVEQLLPPIAPESTRGRRKKLDQEACNGNGVRVTTLTPTPSPLSRRQLPRLVAPH